MLAILVPYVVQQPAPLQVRSFGRAVESTVTESQRLELAESVKRWFGKELAEKGVGFKQDQLLWVVRAPENSHPRIVARGGYSALDTVHLSGDIHFALRRRVSGDGYTWYADVDGTRTEGGLCEFFSVNPLMMKQPGVPAGTLRRMPEFVSHVFEGTRRNWWIYLPPGLKPGDRPAVTVFQDGGGAKNYVPTCFDNLIARGDIPPMVGVFVDPGYFDGNRSNRNFEYDTLSDQYSKFLIDEVLPEVEKVQPLTRDPKMRGLVGASSGGICAFTAAWHRPDYFTKVLSWVGSFVNLAPGNSGIEGGHNYPAMIRKFDVRPIRVFLQDGENDLNNPYGNWPLANQYMANSLEFRGWDYRFEFGHGGHNDRHGRAIMPESLKWLWRDWKSN